MLVRLYDKSTPKKFNHNRGHTLASRDFNYILVDNSQGNSESPLSPIFFKQPKGKGNLMTAAVKIQLLPGIINSE